MRDAGAGHSGCVADSRATWIGAVPVLEASDGCVGGEGDAFDWVRFFLDAAVVVLVVAVGEEEEEARLGMMMLAFGFACGRTRCGSVEAMRWTARRADIPHGNATGILKAFVKPSRKEPAEEKDMLVRISGMAAWSDQRVAGGVARSPNDHPLFQTVSSSVVCMRRRVSTRTEATRLCAQQQAAKCC